MTGAVIVALVVLAFAFVAKRIRDRGPDDVRPGLPADGKWWKVGPS